MLHEIQLLKSAALAQIETGVIATIQEVENGVWRIVRGGYKKVLRNVLKVEIDRPNGTIQSHAFIGQQWRLVGSVQFTPENLINVRDNFIQMYIRNEDVVNSETKTYVEGLV